MKKELLENIENEKQTVGQNLKSARLKASKKLEEVANDLKIRKVYLEAIEKSDYENVPQYPYGIAFISSYANYLGFDGVSFADKYKQETKELNNSAVIQESKEVYTETQGATPSKKNIIIALASLFVICFIWSVASIDSKEDKPQEEPMVEASEVIEIEPAQELTEQDTPPEVIEIIEESYVEEELTPIDAQKEDASNTNKTQRPSNEPVAVDNTPKIKVFEETWVEIKTADKLYLSKVLQAGDEYVLPKRDGLILSVGKINGADLYIGETKMNAVKPTKKINIPLDGFLNKEENI